MSKYIILVAFSFFLLPPPAQADELSEESVKSVYLYNFIHFVTWGEAAFPNDTAPITICILGQNPFGDSLEEGVREKTVNNRSVLVKNHINLDQLDNCHVLFISSEEQEEQTLSKILDSTKGKSILTVGEQEDFAKDGGIVNFILQDEIVHFEINIAAAKQAKLEISFKLLKLAISVYDDN